MTFFNPTHVDFRLKKFMVIFIKTLIIILHSMLPLTPFIFNIMQTYKILLGYYSFNV